MHKFSVGFFHQIRMFKNNFRYKVSSFKDNLFSRTQICIPQLEWLSRHLLSFPSNLQQKKVSVEMWAILIFGKRLGGAKFA